MIFEYSFDLPVPAGKAWSLLLDVYRVAPCMPGASIESGEGNDYVGRIKVRLGPVEMVYRGDLHFTKRDDANHELIVEGAAKDTKGGGGAKANVALRVSPEGANSCNVAIHSDYTVNGKAAQFGRGLMEEVGEKLMSEFASRLKQLIIDDIAKEGQLETADLSAEPLRSRAGDANAPVSSDDALDIGSAAGWAITRRLIIGAAVTLALLAAWWVANS